VKKWRWTGHRLENGYDCHIVLNWTTKGKRAVGRPNTGVEWLRKKEDHFGGVLGLSVPRKAENRMKWRLNMRALCGTWSPREL